MKIHAPRRLAAASCLFFVFGCGPSGDLPTVDKIPPPGTFKDAPPGEPQSIPRSKGRGKISGPTQARLGDAPIGRGLA